MTILLKRSSGRNVILREQAQPAFYPPATVAAVAADIYVHYSDEPPSAARFVRSYGPGEKVTIPHTPATDRNLVVRAIARSARGVADVSELEDASSFTALFQRETDAPVVAQVGASEQGLVQLSITGFSSFAVARQVQIADDNAMSVNVVNDTFDGTPARSTTYYLTRATSPGQTAQTKYVRVRHSSAGVSGPWSAWSTVLAVTFAADGGGGGSSGQGDPWGGGEYSF